MVVGFATGDGIGVGCELLSHAAMAAAQATATSKAFLILPMLAHTAGEMDVIRKSSIFIAGTSAVPGKS